MKTIRNIALLLALTVLFSSCQLIEIDPEYYRVKVVATVGNEEITNGEVQDQFDVFYAYYGSIYASMGMDFSDPEQAMDMKQDILDTMVDDKVKTLKAKKEGYDQLSDEDRQAVEEATRQEYEDAIQNEINTRRSEDESATPSATKSDEEYREEIVALYDESGNSIDTLIENATNTKAVSLLEEATVGDVTATEEEIQADYDEALANDQSQYDADPAAYTGNYLSPEGSIRVKHILVGIPDEEEERAAALEDEANRLDALGNGEELEEGDDLLSVSPSLADMTSEELWAMASEKTAEAAQIRSDAIDALKAEADAVYAKVQAGEDFDTLMAEYGTDDGMKSDPGLHYGYVFNLENNSYVDEFVEGSKNLAVGEYSEPTRSQFGWHIIKRYPDTATVDMVRDSLASEIETRKTTERKDAALAEWKTEFNVKVNYDNIT